MSSASICFVQLVLCYILYFMACILLSFAYAPFQAFMKKIVLLCLYLFHICISHAHTRDTTRIYDAGKKVFVEVLPLADGYNNPCLHLGLEWPIAGDHLAVYGVWGHYLFTQQELNSGNYGTYLKAGIKAYGNKRYSRRIRFDTSGYLSINAFYKSQQMTVYDNIRENDKPGAPVSYIVTKTSAGAHVEIGNFWTFKHLSFESYVGLGIRCTTVSSTATDSLRSMLYHLHEGIVDNIGDASKYRAVLPSMTLGVRIGYVFRRRR